jgi:hypothetical protein
VSVAQAVELVATIWPNVDVGVDVAQLVSVCLFIVAMTRH